MRRYFNKLVAWMLTLVLTMSLMTSVVWAAPQQQETNDSKNSSITSDTTTINKNDVAPKPFTSTEDLVAQMKAEKAKNPESEVINPQEIEMLNKVTASAERKGLYTIEQIRAELEIAIFTDGEESTTDVSKYNLTREEIQFLAGLVLKENSADLLVILTFTANA